MVPVQSVDRSVSKKYGTDDACTNNQLPELDISQNTKDVVELLNNPGDWGSRPSYDSLE